MLMHAKFAHALIKYTLVNVEGLELRLLCMCHVMSE